MMFIALSILAFVLFLSTLLFARLTFTYGRAFLRMRMYGAFVLQEWKLAAIEEGDYVIDTLVKNNVPNSVVNLFKDRYRCMAEQMNQEPELVKSSVG
jgi:hypothetical protein